MLSSEIMHKINQITLETRRLLRGNLAGDHRTTQIGMGFEFDQLRDYQQGDDIRYIDWKSSARSDKFFIRQYREERNRTVVLLVDGSSSQSYGSLATLKYELSAQVSSVIALAADYSQDYTGLIVFSDMLEASIPARRAKGHTVQVMHALFGYAPVHKKTSLAQALVYCMSKYPKNALICIVSDFIDEGFEGLLRAAAQRHDIVALRIIDKNERVFPAMSMIRLCDSEDATLMECSSLSDITALNIFVHEWRQAQDRLFKHLGIDCLDIDSERPFIADIIQFFRMRKI